MKRYLVAVTLCGLALFITVGCGSSSSSSSATTTTTTTTTTSTTSTTTTSTSTTSTTTTTTTSTTTTTLAFRVTTEEFQEGEEIPNWFIATYEGGNNDSISLTWEGVPVATQSLALTMIDLHTIANNFVHWLVIDMPPSTEGLRAAASGTIDMPGTELDNDDGGNGYIGPFPPSGSGVHTYEVTLYALSVSTLNLTQSSTLGAFTAAIAGNILAQDSFIGTFEVR